MKFCLCWCLLLSVLLTVTYAQRGNFRPFNNNFNNNNNNNNFNNNNFNNNNNFRPNNNNNFQQFNNNNNNDNNRQFNFQPVQQQQQQQQQRPQQQQQQQQQQFDVGLDTSDGRFSKFNGPVKGLPHGHGGGKYGAADCLLCPNGF